MVLCDGKAATIVGTGADWLDGKADGLLFGEDQYGDDVDGGPGNDVISGGGGLSSGDRGLDVLVYPRSTAPLQVDLRLRPRASTARWIGSTTANT